MDAIGPWVVKLLRGLGVTRWDRGDIVALNKVPRRAILWTMEKGELPINKSGHMFLSLLEPGKRALPH